MLASGSTPPSQQPQAHASCRHDEYVALQIVSLATRSLCLCPPCQKIAHPLLRKRVPQHRRSQASWLDCFPSIDTQASGLAFLATLLLGVTALLFALITLGKNTSWKLSRQLVCYTISMSTSHLRATHDAAVEECVNSKFLDVVEMLSDAVRRKSKPLEPSGYSPPEALAKVSATLRRVTQPLTSRSFPARSTPAQ